MKSKKNGLIDNLFEHIDDGLLVLDLNGVIISVNDAAANLLAIDKDRLTGQPYSWVFFHETPNPEISQLIYDGLKRNIAHNSKTIDYTDPNNNQISLRLSTSILSRQESLGKLLGKESLLLFIKPGKIALSEAKKESELSGEIQTLQNKNNELIAILKRFDLFKITLAGLIIFTLFFIALFAQNSLRIKPVKDIISEQDFEPVTVPVKYDTLKKQLILVGYLQPHHKVNIIAQTSGTVVKRNFNEGDWVKEDQILFQMDTKELAKNVRTSRVRYMEMLEEYNLLKNWESSLEVMQAKRSLELSKIELNNEKKKLTETKKLFEKGIIPRVEYEKAQTAYKKAEYDYENANQVLAAKLNKGNEEKLQILRLKLSNVKEELDEIEARYEATLIRAPLSGLIMRPENGSNRNKVLKKEGDIVNDGDIVATIGSTDSYIINASIGDLAVANLQPGQQVVATSDAYPHLHLPGRIDWVASKANFTDGNRYYAVRIIIPEIADSLQHDLKIGALVKCAVTIKEYTDVLTVPIQAINWENKQALLYVEKGKEEFEPRFVTVGDNDGFSAIVLDGLEANECVAMYMGKKNIPVNELERK